jgi:small subunit ribosomal protein S1
VDQKYSAKVVRQNEENVFVLIKDRFDGIIPVRTFKKKPADGDVIEVVVTRHNTEEGLYELRIPGGAIDAAAWDDLVVGALLEVKVTAANTGGLECVVNGIRGFVPGGQIDVVRVETFGDYVGKKMELQIIEVDKKKKKLILSRKAILEKDQKEAAAKFMETLETGSYFDGTVTRLMDFGAFISIGNGVEGMAHVSKLSWDRVKHPKDVLAVGQSVRVKVDKINKENGKISLSVKDTMTNPWYGIAERYPDGTVLKGTVTKLADFGAFVSLEAGIEGMVHISELAHGRVSTVQSVVKVGQEIDVKVLSIDTKKRRIALSHKATLAAPVDESKARQKPEVEENTREVAVKPTRDKLQGGRGKSSGGEQFGLRW